jgi:2,3-bisphosphoglycerate-dependent phosphoglycerate mutase
MLTYNLINAGGLAKFGGYMQTNSFCEIYLIRHGETEWNIQGKLQGHTDIPLNDEGEKQALKLKERLGSINFSAVFSSDLSRAKKTAAILLGSKNVKTIETPLLRERYMGLWEGRLTTELKGWFKQEDISTDKLSRDEYLSYKWQAEIESYNEVYNRIESLIRLESISHLGSSILFSSHGGVLRAVLYKLDFRPELRWQVSNCGYIKLRANKESEISIVEFDGVKPTPNASITF